MKKKHYVRQDGLRPSCCFSLSVSTTFPGILVKIIPKEIKRKFWMI